ncbi:acyltransferase [Streptomyces sp. NPDC006482]|uniref:acyltransferase family protein n=1 Tax=unclassified Streptomyces TaxID=2593676 RepID=UPI0022576539|nr:acyltransferase [Streptomyces sp. NBC_00094]MCX5391849.1 acyltransferase [Streptomyces sp. NBC_00094]
MLNQMQPVLPSTRIRSENQLEPNLEVKRPGRLHALDGLRLAAALMVVIYHYTARGGGWSTPVKDIFPETFRISSYGYLGVQLFFIISGFVICMSAWDRPVKAFFVSRVIRLYPAYWFGVIATSVTVAVIPGGRNHLAWNDILTNLTMLQQPLRVPSVDTVYWTLYTELRFYLLFALVAWWGLTYKRVLLFCCVWGAATVIVTKAPAGPLKTLLIPEYSWFFIAGMAFYLMYRFRPNLMLFGVVGVSFCASLASTFEEAKALTWLGPRAGWPVIVILASFFVVMSLIATGKLSRIQWKWLPIAGALTYPVYLLHQVIGWEFISYYAPRGVDPWVLVGTLTAGSLVLAYLVHKLVEKPVSRYLKRNLAQL